MHVLAELDRVVGQFVLKQLVEVDTCDIRFIDFHFDVVLSNLLVPFFERIVVLLRFERFLRHHCVLLLGEVGHVARRLCSRLLLSPVNLGDFLPFVEHVSWNGHTDLLLEFRFLVEDGFVGLDDTRWLINLLTLLHALVVIILLLLDFEVCRADTFGQVVHHLDDALALALAQRVLPEQVQISILFRLEQVLLEHTVELVSEHVEVIELHIADFIGLLVRL